MKAGVRWSWLCTKVEEATGQTYSQQVDHHHTCMDCEKTGSSSATHDSFAISVFLASIAQLCFARTLAFCQLIRIPLIWFPEEHCYCHIRNSYHGRRTQSKQCDLFEVRTMFIDHKDVPRSCAVRMDVDQCTFKRKSQLGRSP